MNHFFKILFLYIILIFSISSLYGQEKDSLCLFSGQIDSKDGKYPVALAHIINLQQRWGVVADTLGFFEIWAKPGDILNFSAIGFDYLEYRVERIYKDSIVHISLQNRYYEIPEVSITYLGTYKDFEYKVLHLELPDINLINEQVLRDLPKAESSLVIKPNIGSPISLVYDLLSREGKERRKYQEIQEEEKEKVKVKERFNETLVMNLTGLGYTESFEFMKFCNFSDNYILSITDYKLFADILMHFEAYKKSKKDSVISE